jgi:hypothetical protein
MTETEMYDHMRSLQRKGMEPLPALYETLKKAGSETMDFHPGDRHLYVRCDMMPPHSIRTCGFLAGAAFMTWRIVAFNRLVDLDSTKTPIATPYINIYKEPK